MFLIRSDGELAGLALVRELAQHTVCMVEFFNARSFAVEVRKASRRVSSLIDPR